MTQMAIQNTLKRFKSHHTKTKIPNSKTEADPILS
uniref:Uncharacterized protein n=1 Tax=Manihot esculenta TaxID=3983 RepID=A0A2C9VEF8_MANES